MSTSNTKAPRAEGAGEDDADNNSIVTATKMAHDGECVICAETFNLSTRKYIKCMYCEFAACRKCCETYMLSENIQHCMNSQCEKPWSRLFISQNFTKVFASKTLKAHLENVAFEKEQALLPETQIVVEYERESNRRLEVLNFHIDELTKQLIEYKNEHWQLSNNLKNALATGTVPVHEPTDVILGRHEQEARKNFIRACPANDCRGFLSSRWKCGICEQYTCCECYALKEEGKEHECNPDDVKTAKLLSKDTKPCPKCASMIFKIDGCDQMWCVECKTAFSWKTGRQQTQIHNPHYYEYLRRTGNQQQLQDLNAAQNANYNCGNRCYTDHQLLYTFSRNLQNSKIKGFTTYIKNHLYGISEVLNHLENAEMQSKFRANEDELNLQRFRIRSSYIKGHISKEHAQISFLRIYKDYDKKREYRELLNMYLQTMDDIYRRLIHEFPTNAKIKDLSTASEETNNIYANIVNQTLHECNIMREINSITEYVNQHMKQISETYNCVNYKILNLSDYNDIKLIKNTRKTIVYANKNSKDKLSVSDT